MTKQQIPETLQPFKVKISTLNPYDRNARQGDIGALVQSLEKNGQYRPIVVNKKGNVILAGNHTFWAAKELGWKELAATFVDVDDATARRIVLVDNRSGDLASYDDHALTELLTEIHEAEGPEGLIGTGFDPEDLDGLVKALETPEFVPEYDDTLADRAGNRDKVEVECPECGHQFKP